MGIMTSAIDQLRGKTDTKSKQSLAALIKTFQKMLGKPGKAGEKFIARNSNLQRMKTNVLDKYQK